MYENHFLKHGDDLFYSVFVCSKNLLGVSWIWEKVVVIGQGDVSGGDDFAREPPPVQRVDRGHRRRHARTLDVNVALRK